MTKAQKLTTGKKALEYWWCWCKQCSLFSL